MIVTEWDQFRALDSRPVEAGDGGKPVIVDLRNIYRPDDMRSAASPMRAWENPNITIVIINKKSACAAATIGHEVGTAQNTNMPCRDDHMSGALERVSWQPFYICHFSDKPPPRLRWKEVK